jgi:hypothetical protein
MEINQSGTDIQFVEYIVKQLVDFPEAVRVVRKIDERGVLLVIESIDSRDIGKIIGKSGKVIESIRNLVRVLGMRLHTKLHLKINEPESGSRYESDSSSGTVSASSDSVDGYDPTRATI